jgi:hypothetical protein
MPQTTLNLTSRPAKAPKDLSLSPGLGAHAAARPHLHSLRQSCLYRPFPKC